MLQNLSEQVRECLRRAEECAQQAKHQCDPKLAGDYLDLERRWFAATNWGSNSNLSQATSRSTGRAKSWTDQRAGRQRKSSFRSTSSARAPETRDLSFHRCSTAQLVAGRDLSRQHAKFIDVPVADEHLDRGYHSLIAAAPLGIAPPLSPQAFEIDCRYISIVSHDPSPSQCRPQALPQRWR